MVAQTVLPSKIIVVNDNSSDKTAEIVTSFSEKYPFITLVNKKMNYFFILYVLMSFVSKCVNYSQCFVLKNKILQPLLEM